jgi:hypothetical protein
MRILDAVPKIKQIGATFKKAEKHMPIVGEQPDLYGKEK